MKKNAKESVEEIKKETEKKKEMEKEREEEKTKEKSDAETINAKNLQDNVSVEKSTTFNAISLPKEIKIRNEVGKSDLIKLSELKEVTYLTCSNFKPFL